VSISLSAAAIPESGVQQNSQACRNICKNPEKYSAAPLPTFTGYTGFFYFAAAAAMGLSWLVLAWWGTADVRAWSRRPLLFSILTLTVLSVTMPVAAVGPSFSPCS